MQQRNVIAISIHTEHKNIIIRNLEAFKEIKKNCIFKMKKILIL
jgi:hypothetical protein